MVWSHSLADSPGMPEGALTRTRPPMIHPTADVSPTAEIGHNTRIWHQVQIRDGAQVGANCIFGKGAYVDEHVFIGSNCKIQNYALLYAGARLGNGVFIGPGAILTNDRYPRAINPDGTLKADGDWSEGTIKIEDGASIGAGAVLVTGITIGKFAMIAAGSVVTRSVPSHALFVGTPAIQRGWVCRCGRPLTGGTCPNCGDRLDTLVNGD